MVAGTLFGIMGVILAVPAAAALRVLVDELWVGRMDEDRSTEVPGRWALGRW